MDRNLTEAEEFLIIGLKARNDAIFKEVYDLYWSKLYVSAYNILRDKEQSEDVVQEVFGYLWHRAPSLQIQSLSAWLFTAVRYQVFNIIRSGKVRSKFEGSLLQEVAISNLAEIKLDNDAIQKRILESLDKLPPRCREIFMLSRFEHLTHKEISEKMSISEKTVENQITIALKKLRLSLNDLAYILPFLLFKW